MPIEIKDALELILADVQPEVVLEEWSVTQLEESGAAAVSDSLGIPWRSIGTTDDAEFATFGFERALDFPSSGNIGERRAVQCARKTRTYYAGQHRAGDGCFTKRRVGNWTRASPLFVPEAIERFRREELRVPSRDLLTASNCRSVASHDPLGNQLVHESFKLRSRDSAPEPEPRTSLRVLLPIVRSCFSFYARASKVVAAFLCGTARGSGDTGGTAGAGFGTMRRVCQVALPS